MRLSRRQLLLSILPTALALNACQQIPSILDGPSARIALPQRVTVVVPVPNKAGGDRLDSRMKEFQSQNPNLAVELRPITGMPNGPFNIEKWADLLAALASSALLDIAVGWDIWAPELIDRGILRPLDPYLADIGRPIERFFMVSSVQAFRRTGRVWMLPWQAQPIVLFYNRQLFDQAGLPAPDKRWTWNDIEAVGSVLTRGQDKAKVWGYDIATGTDALIYQNGGRLVDDPIEPIKPMLDEPANIEALTWLENAVKRLRITPGGTDLRQWDQRTAAFTSSQIAMRLDRMSSRAGTYIGSPKAWTFPWGVIPAPGRVTRATSANFQSWGILAGSTRVDESWALLRHLCTTLPGEARIDGVPAFLALQDTSEFHRLLPEGTDAYLSALTETIPSPAIPAASQIQNLLNSAMMKVITSAATPAEALKEAQAGAIKAWVKPKPTPVPPPPS